MSYKKLEIWDRAREVSISIHKMTLTELPKFEMYEEGSQIRRSSKAVAAMIIEGYGRRRYKADFIRYLIISHGECDETILHLDFLFETKSLLDEPLHNRLVYEYQQLSKKINNYIRWVEDHWNDFALEQPLKPAT